MFTKSYADLGGCEPCVLEETYFRDEASAFKALEAIMCPEANALREFGV